MKKSLMIMGLALGSSYSFQSEAASYWVPYVASPTGGGSASLYVIPSDNLDATPTRVGSFATPLEGSLQVTVNSSNVVTEFSPSAMMYLAVGSDGKTHVYGLNLTDVSTAPKASQLGSFALAAPAATCGLEFTEMATNAFEPTTAFVLLHTNPKGASECNKGGDQYQVVHYTDSVSTAPTAVNITVQPEFGDAALPGLATPIYASNGALGGVVLVSSAGDLEFYAGDTFTTPKLLTSGVTSVTPLYLGAPSAGAPVPTLGVAFFAVSKGNKQSVWRVTSSGVATNVYSAAGAIGGYTSDSANVYFFDNVTVADSDGGGEGMTTQHLYKVALAAGTATHLYTAPAVVSGATMLGQLGLTLVGSNGSALLMESVQLPTTTIESSVVTLPVGGASAPTAIAGPFSGVDSLEVMMCPQQFGSPELEDVLMNISSSTIKDEVTEISYSSEMVTMSGKIIQEKLAGSLFVSTVPAGLESTPQCPSSAGLIAQVRGITATNGSYGGGTLVAYNLHGDLVPPLPAVQALHTSSGDNYVIASTDAVGGNSIFTSGGSILAGYVGTGAPALPPGPDGLAIDFSKGLISVFTVPKANLESIL